MIAAEEDAATHSPVVSVLAIDSVHRASERERELLLGQLEELALIQLDGETNTAAAETAHSTQRIASPRVADESRQTERAPINRPLKFFSCARIRNSKSHSAEEPRSRSGR